MSSPKTKARLTVNQQVKAGLNAVRDFLAGRSGDAKPEGAPDPATREVVAAELLAAMSGRKTNHSVEETGRESSSADMQEIPRLEAQDQSSQASPESAEVSQSLPAADPIQPGGSTDQERERARELFLDYGYFEEAVEKLGSAKVVADRVAAAQALGLFGSQRATAHLIAAMFDDDADVRSAAEEALASIGEPTPGKTSLETESNIAGVTEPVFSQPATELASVEPTSGPGESGTIETKEGITTTSVTSAEATDQENQLIAEEQAIIDKVEQLGKQLLETAAAIKEAQNEVQWRIEREGHLRTEAAESRRKEEELRKAAAEEAERRQAQEREALASEQAARLKAQSEIERHAAEEINLRLTAARLVNEAEDLARRRSEMERARFAAECAAREAETARVRDELKSRHEAALSGLRSEAQALTTATNEVAQQQAGVMAAREKAETETKRLKEEQAAVAEAQRVEAERLRSEAEARNAKLEAQLREQLEQLRLAGEGVAARRAEVEEAQAKADAEAERLVEAQSRMRLAEAARAEAETERARLEAEINQQVETHRGLLHETRSRGEAEKARLQEELKRHAEAEEHRLNELQAMRAGAEAESKQLIEQEHQILSQIDSLRITDTETRRRIAEAEARHRAAEDAYRLVAEKVQRVEAEAHARVKEEERIIAKLEAELRTVAIEAQSRAEQEKRIKEEIEVFRRLEEEERPRIEEATLQLAAAEARLQERKDRLKEEEQAREFAEQKLDDSGEYPEPSPGVGIVPGTETTEALPADSVGAANSLVAKPIVAEVIPLVDETEHFDDVGSSGVTPAIATYLTSVNPYKRAAAVAELARLGGPDAFDQIVECFDDHSSQVRNAAARAFRKLEPKHTVDLFNRALEGASASRRQNIGAAIAASGLAAAAIENLGSENREDTYNALSVLFVMAKTGELHPLVQAIEGHESVQVRMAAIKLLTLTGQAEIANAAAKRRLETKPPEVDYLS